MDAATPKHQVGLIPYRIPILLCASALGLIGALAALYHRSQLSNSRVALVDKPKGVTTTVVRAAKYRPSRIYVGTVAPWLEARIGPQFTAAYVDTVLVRPGAQVKRGQVLATLDCRNASAQNKALAMQARALSATQEAIEKEATRVSGLLSGGYVSPNEVERRTAESTSKQAELLAAQARMSKAALEVDDCVLRAPFEGEISERMIDPGGFARPGVSILSIVDRSQVRVLLDVPETDFAVVAPGTPAKMKILATGMKLQGQIARRAPSADASTRTIHAELDLADAEGKIPVGTTAELVIEVGEKVDAIEIPLRAATVRGDSASLYAVEQGIARKRKIEVIGESGGSLFLKPVLSASSHVVVEGRALLSDGDTVVEQLEAQSLGQSAARVESGK